MVGHQVRQGLVYFGFSDYHILAAGSLVYHIVPGTPLHPVTDTRIYITAPLTLMLLVAKLAKTE